MEKAGPPLFVSTICVLPLISAMPTYSRLLSLVPQELCRESPISIPILGEKPEGKEGVEVGSSLSANREIRRAYTYIRRRKVLWTERVPLKCYVEALMPSVMVLGGNQE